MPNFAERILERLALKNTIYLKSFISPIRTLQEPINPMNITAEDGCLWRCLMILKLGNMRTSEFKSLIILRNKNLIWYCLQPQKIHLNKVNWEALALDFRLTQSWKERLDWGLYFCKVDMFSFFSMNLRISLSSHTMTASQASEI